MVITNSPSRCKLEYSLEAVDIASLSNDVVSSNSFGVVAVS